MDTYAGDIESLQNEVDRITELYQQIEYDYQTLCIEYENLMLQTRYRLNEIFKREDLVLSYNLPDRIYTSPSFTIEGTTSNFECNLWCDQATSSSSAQIRIYKAGTPVRAYSHPVRLKESPETELYYAEGSFSIVLAEGSYYITLVIDSGSLSPLPIYQFNIQIWDYY